MSKPIAKQMKVDIAEVEGVLSGLVSDDEPQYRRRLAILWLAGYYLGYAGFMEGVRRSDLTEITSIGAADAQLDRANIDRMTGGTAPHASYFKQQSIGSDEDDSEE